MNTRQNLLACVVGMFLVSGPPLRAQPTVAPGAETLAHHLATNAAGRTRGFTGNPGEMFELSGWKYDTYSTTNLGHLTNSVWSTNFWLKGVQGLSATSIGFSNRLAGQGVVTMVSPRHCLFATHMHQGQDHFMAAFLDTNNVIHWRVNVQQADVGDDTSVGLLNADLPPSVGFLPVLPANFADYLPANSPDLVQGIGMNQDLRLFSEPMVFGNPNYPNYVIWSSTGASPLGPGTNWNVAIRGGDSSAPVMLLIGNQLVLVSHNFAATAGPNYARQIATINQKLHQLSISTKAGTDYQLTPFSLAKWPAVH